MMIDDDAAVSPRGLVSAGRGGVADVCLAALAVVLLAAAIPARAAVRKPAVAGAFYPADPKELRSMVSKMLAAAGRPARPALAIIAPHAGYVFSGPTAATAFAGLEGETIRRVILLGPSHHRGFAGAALPAPEITAFATPLGEVSLDRGAVETLRRRPGFDGPAAAHDPEHSLEVELPFLQVMVPKATIVPILVGSGTEPGEARRLAHALAPLLREGTVVVTSSDFTHHGEAYRWAPFAGKNDMPQRLLALGHATAGRAAAMDWRGFWNQVEVSGDTVCGEHPIETLLQLLSHAFRGTGRLAALTTSGKVTGQWDRSVTYAAVQFTGRWRPWEDDPPPPRLGALDEAEQEALLELARATLETHLEHGPQLANWYAGHEVRGNLAAIAGAFVTINRRGVKPEEGRLRGCIGSIIGRAPLADTVVHAAASAAHDPRFPPLQAGELPRMTLEISVLSPLRRVPGPQAVVLGRDGVILEKSGRRAVYLPQVATETGWDRATLLSHLSVKAGLSPDAWREGARFEVFTAQVFSEEEKAKGKKP